MFVVNSAYCKHECDEIVLDILFLYQLYKKKSAYVKIKKLNFFIKPKIYFMAIYFD